MFVILSLGPLQLHIQQKWVHTELSKGRICNYVIIGLSLFEEFENNLMSLKVDFKSFYSLNILLNSCSRITLRRNTDSWLCYGTRNSD